MSKITYKDSGVDVEKGDFFVEKIKSMARRTYNNKVISGVGGFACLFETSPGKYLAAGTDGVGTKLELAQKLNKHDTIGIDLVAMCANDIICTGARPLFFLDYLACGSLDLNISCEIVKGIVAACEEVEMALIGGETAEMPDMYAKGVYDLAGFCVGEVTKENLIDGSRIKAGNDIIALASSGVHSNGFSLVRKLFTVDEPMYQEALIPTKLYVKVIEKIMGDFPEKINGLAHITGGGINNIARPNSNFDYVLDNLPAYDLIPPIFSEIAKRSELSKEELYTTFNMGMGMAIICDDGDELLAYLDQVGVVSWKIGKVVEGSGEVKITSTLN